MRYIEIPLVDIPLEQTHKDLVERVYYVDPRIADVEIARSSVIIEVDEGVDVDVQAIGHSINDVVASLNHAFSKDFSEILYMSSHEGGNGSDPWPRLLAERCVKPVEPGLCYLSAEMVELLECADGLFKRYAESKGAVMESYTSVIPFSSAVKNGYLESFPQHALFVAAAHRNLDAIEQVTKVAESDANGAQGWLAYPGHLLAPTVCYHCFEALKDQVIDQHALFSARGLCHRNESAKDSLLRLKVFNMREIIFFGEAGYVELTRQEIINFCQSLVESLRVKFRMVTASDPFFGSGTVKRRTFQQISRSKIELQIYIPHNRQWSSIASFNNHSETLTRKYSIGPAGLCSGCFGVGYERLLYALICQLGVDIKQIGRLLHEGYEAVV